MGETVTAIHAPLSLYIHLPWCLHKCAYCDFNSHATQADSFPEQAYLDALVTDLTRSSHAIKQRGVQSIFIGGGTPSLFSPSSIEALLDACHKLIRLNTNCEITLETNPGTFEYQKFSEFLAAGINRLSIGVQSLNNHYLKTLERIHSKEEAICAIETAHTLGFKNINADLMFGLPGQSVKDAHNDIQALCELPLTHISYYQLTLEPNTVFYRFPPSLPSDDTVFTIQNNGIDTLAKHGFIRYEVSAYARKHKQCMHNTNYWRFGDYLGIGAGAHSKLTSTQEIIRHQRVRQPDSYIQAVSANTHIINEHKLDKDTLIFEFMLNNLRLTQGFTPEAFTESTELDWSLVAPRIRAYIDEGLMEMVEHHYRASAHGYQFLDELTQRFLPDQTCS